MSLPPDPDPLSKKDMAKRLTGNPDYPYKLLKKEGFERLDITRHDRNYFYSKKEYNQFLQVFTTSFEKNKNN